MLKKLKLLLTIGLVFTIVFIIEKVKTGKKEVKNITEQKSDRSFEHTRKKLTAVLLISQFRSGSSILGEIFNRNKNVTYLFEPLYPLSYQWQSVHDDLVNESVRSVELMVRCQFEHLTDLYWKAFGIVGKADEQG